MKNQFSINLSIIIALAAVASLTACGSSESKETPLVTATEVKTETKTDTTTPQPTPIAPIAGNPGKVGCPNLAGNYETVGVPAKMQITQDGCNTLTIQQTCTDRMCGFFNMGNFSATLTLDGKPVSVAEGSTSMTYKTNFNSKGVLMIERNDGVFKAFSLADHPCNANNPEPGIEVNIVETTRVTATKTCQPWAKR